jgi:hypothetical protein
MEGKPPPVDQAMIQFLSEQLQQLHLDIERKEQDSINANNTVLARVMYLEICQKGNGVRAGNGGNGQQDLGLHHPENSGLLGHPLTVLRGA